MPTIQSSLVDATAQFKGSALLEIAAYDAAKVAALVASTAYTDSVSWVDVGSVDGLKFGEKIKSQLLKGDNSFESKYVSDQALELSFNQREACAERIREIVRGSFDVSGTPVAGSAVPAQSDVFASGSWAFNTFIPLPHQNGDGSSITITSITASTDGVLSADPDGTTEYVPAVENGVYGFVVLPAASIAAGAAQSLTVVYPYTPNASQTTYSGGKTTMPYFMMRLTNVDENGKAVRFWGYKGSLDDGMDFAFKKDDDSDPVVSQAIKATFIVDTSVATPGKQLFKMYQDKGI